MQKNSRLILAVALSAALMFAVFFIQERFTPKTKPVAGGTNTTAAPAASAAPVIPLANASSVKIEPVARGVEETVTIDNGRVKAQFSSVNAVLTSYMLSDYHMLDGANVEMIARHWGNLNPFYVSFTDASNSINNNERILFTIEERSSNKVVFSADVKVNNVPFRMRKIFTMKPNDYLVDLDVQFQNMSGKPADLTYSLFLGSGLGPYRAQKERTQDDIIKVNYLRTGKKDKSDVFSGHEKGFKYKAITEQKEWLAIEGRYFAIITSPPKYEYFAESVNMGNPTNAIDIDGYQTANYRASLTVAPNQLVSEKYASFIGPKKRTMLPEYNRNYESIFKEQFIFINIRPLTYAMNWMLDFFFKLTKHYAWAIILFTIVYKLVTFPLSQSSYKSMKKMSELTPKLEELKKQYRNDPQRLNTETMNMYKKEKVNPLGGCLPMLLPFPILIAFFYMMQNMVELRNVSFMWIKDLTSPDRLMTINGFDVNLLPILMTATTYVTTMLTPKTGSKEQADQMKIFNVALPAVFLFFFYGMASGLVLYWTLMNLLGIIQQVIVNQVTHVTAPAATAKKR
ncbi:MAG: membrane protein insertase YidC [Spirochaetes bacterium]|nr:membrane protein insertase YidC [Spirochaetota bacterium]